MPLLACYTIWRIADTLDITIIWITKDKSYNSSSYLIHRHVKASRNQTNNHICPHDQPIPEQSQLPPWPPIVPPSPHPSKRTRTETNLAIANASLSLSLPVRGALDKRVRRRIYVYARTPFLSLRRRAIVQLTHDALCTPPSRDSASCMYVCM